MRKYQIIYADPPWEYSDGRGARSRGCAKSAFPLMPLETIKSLPVEAISSKDSVLFLWVTMPMLKEGLEVIEAWGFKYRTCAFTWVKLNEISMGIYSGLGYWTNGNAELCLFGRKGNPKRISRNIKQIVLAPVLEHSHKPLEVRERITQLMGELPRIELFARQKVEGWDCWGNQVESDIDLMELV